MTGSPTAIGKTSDGLVVKIAASIDAIGPEAWTRCAAGHQTGAPLEAALPSPADDDDAAAALAGPDVDRCRYNPFLSYEFLHALEVSGSVGGRTGWTPLHVVVERAGEIVGVMPAYGKSHSQGEYVFDHGWADALERAGGRYYPKIQVAVPFTPATGRRFLVRDGEDRDAIRGALIAGAKAALTSIRGSSIHITFCGRTEWDWLGAEGLLQRVDQQFHWINEGYHTYDDFLAVLASRKRKTIKRERRDALADGAISIERLTGDAITPEAWNAFYEFYMDTGSRKWGRPYLTRAFYTAIAATMADRIMLVMARREGRYIAGAINFIGSDALYGRHWGCIENHPFLHFEVCYHQAIEFAIERGLGRVEAGAQGEHKLARGYRPVMTYSAHWIENPGFRRAVEDYLEHERAQVAMMQEALEDAAPFRKGSITTPPRGQEELDE